MAGCESCKKEISTMGMIVSEEFQAWLIASEELQAQFNVWEVFWAWCHLGGASCKALSVFSLELCTDSCVTALEEYADVFEFSYHVGWFRVIRG